MPKRKIIRTRLLALLIGMTLAIPAASAQYSSNPGTIGRMTIFSNYVRATSYDTTHPVASCPSGGFVLLSSNANYNALLAAMIAAQHGEKQIAFVVDNVCHNGDGAVIQAIHVYTN